MAEKRCQSPTSLNTLNVDCLRALVRKKALHNAPSVLVDRTIFPFGMNAGDHSTVVQFRLCCAVNIVDLACVDFQAFGQFFCVYLKRAVVRQKHAEGLPCG